MTPTLRVIAAWLAALFLVVGLSAANANEAAPAVADPVLEARMLAITAELRCLVCQNQTIADSHAELAGDLRKQILELMQQGKTDQEIMEDLKKKNFPAV